MLHSASSSFNAGSYLLLVVPTGERVGVESIVELEEVVGRREEKYGNFYSSRNLTKEAA